MESQRPEHLSVIEWWQYNCKKGIIDALIEVGQMLSHMQGEDNTGNMEAVVDGIDDIIGENTLTASTAKMLYETEGVEAVVNEVSSMVAHHKDPAYVRKYLEQEGRVRGYINTLQIIRNLAEMKGY